MFITKKGLDRRTVLRGMGAGLALPLLDAMVPALTPVALSAVLRGADQVSPPSVEVLILIRRESASSLHCV